MIFFVTTASHKYTHAHVEQNLSIFRRVSYPVLLTRRRLRRGVYIFSDFDRLSAWQLELAAHRYRQLAKAGCRVLNDPARALQRLSLLQRLHEQEINAFEAWPATQSHAVVRFPVFIRTQAAHRGVIGDLLHDLAALETAIEAAVENGYPVHDLMICEYCAEPLREGLFRKFSLYRVGDEMIPAVCVHERQWMAKYGETGVAELEDYEAEFRMVKDNPFADAVRAAFEVARIDYGRADFGMVGGRPQVYEINTNPSIYQQTAHPFAVRMRTSGLVLEKLLASIARLDTPSSGWVHVAQPDHLRIARRRSRIFPGYQWMP